MRARPEVIGADPLAELPSPQPFARWPEELGEPDALVTVPVQSVKAIGVEPYRYIFIQGRIRPTCGFGRRSSVRPTTSRCITSSSGWVASATVDRPIIPPTRVTSPAFVPGTSRSGSPGRRGVLGRSNWLTFNLHYTPNGIATNDQPVLALWSHRSRPAKTWNLAAPLDSDLIIPPGADDHPVQATWTTPNTPIEIHRLNPHMHLRGKRAKFEVRYPNGVREILLSVPDYDFNWQVGYTLAEPKSIPAGSQIIVAVRSTTRPRTWPTLIPPPGFTGATSPGWKCSLATSTTRSNRPRARLQHGPQVMDIPLAKL